MTGATLVPVELERGMEGAWSADILPVRRGPVGDSAPALGLDEGLGTTGMGGAILLMEALRVSAVLPAPPSLSSGLMSEADELRGGETSEVDELRLFVGAEPPIEEEDPSFDEDEIDFFFAEEGLPGARTEPDRPGEPSRPLGDPSV